MGVSGDFSDAWSSTFGAVAAAPVDDRGTVVRWSRAAADLVGRDAGEVCGRPVRELVASDRVPAAGSSSTKAGAAGIPASGRVLLRHGSGGTVDVTFRSIRWEGASEQLVLAAPTGQVVDQDQGASLLRALLSQDRIAISLHDADLAIVRTNLTPDMFAGPPATPAGRLREVLTAEDAADAEAALREVLETGVPLVDRIRAVRSPQTPGREWALSLSVFRLEDAHGHPNGVAVVSRDITEEEQTRQGLELVHEAAARVGGTLDVARTAQELADMVVPLGDLASVDLADAVLVGDEPPKWVGGGDPHTRKIAAASATGRWPAGHIQVGEAIPRFPDIDQSLLSDLRRDGFVIVGRDRLLTLFGGDPGLVDLLMPPGGHSIVLAPLLARGLALGNLSVWRTERPEPFTKREADLVREIASRGALAIDNARRYTREHQAAVALQRRLLPRASTDLPAVETTGLYRPAGGGAEISGDWFDVIPLPSLRVALVVGDVVGHGLHAAATMGRLRTAIRTLADLEIDPADLFTHVEDLVQRLAEEAPHEDVIGASCLYAVYDPISCRCTLISAGHPPPVVVRPDGTAQVVALSPGPPLAVSGMPHETVTIDVEPGSLLVLYTDGLIDREGHDTDAGLRQLTDALPALHRSGRSLGEIGRAVLAEFDDRPPRDDIALLLARTRALPADSTASWDYPADPAVVARARRDTARQLAAWGLDELAFTTELVVSELVTNAVRYGGAPIGLRLIRDAVLICEVTDPSNTQPRLRRARTTDEGGRGMFLIAQLSARWGCRYGRRGKTIWAEQPLTAHPGANLFESVDGSGPG
jgi:serine phosphatase RsbU (regulator of sigma subunit)/PAS domain-containing protein/anti-sigma regulatory factor (Ser/Thr protein kinase)